MLDALENLRLQPSENAALDKWVSDSSQKAGFAQHMLGNEVLQVVYGLNKTLQHRFDQIYIIAFGTDAGLAGAYHQVCFLFHSGAIRQMGYKKYFWLLLKSLPHGFKIFCVCHRQNKKWPLIDNWHHLNTSIERIKSEYGIWL